MGSFHLQVTGRSDLKELKAIKEIYELLKENFVSRHEREL